MKDTLNGLKGCALVLLGLGGIFFYGYHIVSGIVTGDVHYFTRWHDGFIQWQNEPWRFVVGVFADVFFLVVSAVAIWAGFSILNKIPPNDDR